MRPPLCIAYFVLTIIVQVPRKDNTSVLSASGSNSNLQSSASSFEAGQLRDYLADITLSAHWLSEMRRTEVEIKNLQAVYNSAKKEYNAITARLARPSTTTQLPGKPKRGRGNSKGNTTADAKSKGKGKEKEKDSGQEDEEDDEMKMIE